MEYKVGIFKLFSKLFFKVLMDHFMRIEVNGLYFLG